jgi:hypothetical protein
MFCSMTGGRSELAAGPSESFDSVVVGMFSARQHARSIARPDGRLRQRPRDERRREFPNSHFVRHNDGEGAEQERTR